MRPERSVGTVQPKALRQAPWLGEAGTAFYIGLIALVAEVTHLPYVLFPELGALSRDILKRPHGTWAKAPLMLVITPAVTGIIGTLVNRHYGRSDGRYRRGSPTRLFMGPVFLGFPDGRNSAGRGNRLAAHIVPAAGGHRL